MHPRRARRVEFDQLFAQFRGVLRDDDVLAGQHRGVETLAELTREEISPVSVDAPLADLFTSCAETPLPVPVVDDAGRLVGVIPRVTLLEAMAPAAAGASPSGEVDDADGPGADPSPPEELAVPAEVAS